MKPRIPLLLAFLACAAPSVASDVRFPILVLIAISHALATLTRR
jgi:hypothetical protein